MVWVKRGLSLVLLAALLYFFWPLIGELRAAGALFGQARWGWLAAALGLQALSYAFLTWLNALSLQPFGGRIGFLKLAAVLTSMAFIQIAIPSAGASGAALRVRLLSKFGYRSEEALFSLVVESLAEILVLAFVALAGVFYLLRNTALGWGDLLWILLLVVAVAALSRYLWKVLTSAERSRRFLVQWVGLWNRSLGRRRLGQRALWLDLEQIEPRWRAFRENLGHYRAALLWKIGLAAIGKVLLDIASLGAAFWLFGHALPPATLFTGYGLVLTFSGTAALPAGIGMGDASVPVIFSWLAVPAAVALAAGLTYRLIAFWLVRFIGFVAWLALEARS